MSGSAAPAAAPPPAAEFSNATVGITLTKPAGWHYTSAAQNLDNVKAMKLEDEDFRATMKQYATAPLVAMTNTWSPSTTSTPASR